MCVDEVTPMKVKCPLCGEHREPPDPVVGLVWAVMGCEQCLIKHDERAKELLTAANLLEDDEAN